VSSVIPVCAFELCRVKVKSAVPPDASVVPPVTVNVSAAVLPTVVVIVELDSDADGGALIVYVTVRVLEPEEFEAVKVCVKLVVVARLIVTRPVDALNETPEFGVFMDSVIGPAPVAVTVSYRTKPAVPATADPPELLKPGPFGYVIEI
jgi:hypothetical protein